VLVPFWHVKDCTGTMSIEPLVTIGYPEVWADVAQVDVGFLTKAMCSIDHRHDTPLTTEGDHFFPRKIDTRDGNDAVDDSHNLQLCSVTGLTLSYLQFGVQSIDVSTESLEDRCAGRGEVQFKYGDRRVGWQIADIFRHTFYGKICRRGRDDDIPLIPCEIPENGVQSMRGIRHENDFFGPGADELGYAASGRCEVLGICNLMNLSTFPSMNLDIASMAVETGIGTEP